ncbi:HD domain-containing protein [Desemzia sp. FAM 23991]|uniref:HD domain-containing protein n=1 Tax=unclassified Desemzia TaxID=2685243 RepID=UPI0038899327
MKTDLQKEILKQTEQFVFQLLKKDASGHDWWHIHRVRNLALQMAAEEPGEVDAFICEMAALLHDVPDEKLNETPEAGEKKLTDWLNQLSLTHAEKESLLFIVLNLSYKGGTNKIEMTSIEGKLVQDADRLDAIGAIGIARTMAYSGSRGRLIHDPSKMPREGVSYEEYRSGEDTAIMHFYEKLLKLKDTMNTQTGRSFAENRHQFMEQFLQEFYLEWDGLK